MIPTLTLTRACDLDPSKDAGVPDRSEPGGRGGLEDYQVLEEENATANANWGLLGEPQSSLGEK